MRLLLILFSLFVVRTTSTVPASFDWEAGGSYTATGKGAYYVTSPAFSEPFDCNVTLYVDTVGKNIWFIAGTSCGNQYVTATQFCLMGSPALPPGVCACRPLGYDDYVNKYKQLLKKSWTELTHQVYGGLVDDPGLCNTSSAGDIRVFKLLYWVTEYDLHWIKNPPNPFGVRIQAQVKFNTWRFGVPDKPELPSECDTPEDYCTAVSHP